MCRKNPIYVQIYVLIALIIIGVVSLPVAGRRVSLKLGSHDSKKVKESRSAAASINGCDILPADTVGVIPEGCFVVSQKNGVDNHGYGINQVTFSGFDKTIKSSKESFFIKNNTDRTLNGIVVSIDYRMPDGRQLTKRLLRLACDIPAGETRKADIPTFDCQHSYYYLRSVAPKNGGNPFDVIFTPQAYYLQFLPSDIQQK